VVGAMTVLVLLGPAATEPVELARRVAEDRPLTAVVDVASVIATLAPMLGADADAKRSMGIDLATGMATRLSGLGIDVILAEATPRRSTSAYRDGLLFVDRVTLMALTADPGRLAMRDLSRGPDMLSGLHAWRSWRANLDQLRTSTPTFTDYDVILDCADRSRADLVRLIAAAL
jgi:hypothetical protein